MLISERHIESVIAYFKGLQSCLCQQISALDSDNPFITDHWQHACGGGGTTRLIENGEVFERGGVNFSHVVGGALPKSASATRLQIEGLPFQACGVSLVMHPQNPFVPTAHMNVRFFQAEQANGEPIWWFGGGFDLTPFYGFVEDCKHWHDVAQRACESFGKHYYEKFKQQCDQYFFIKHRQENRGIGGLFFDDFNELGFKRSFELTQSIGNAFSEAYLPIVNKRMAHKFTEPNRTFQLIRRGRYVEFNLVYDRGTLFGLQSNGRIESILMSMPPQVSWQYQYQADAESEEEKLLSYYLKPKDWLSDSV